MKELNWFPGVGLCVVIKGQEQIIEWGEVAGTKNYIGRARSFPDKRSGL